MVLSSARHFRGSLNCLADLSRLLPGSTRRGFRADATDPDAEKLRIGDDGSEDKRLVADAQQPSGRGRHASAGLGPDTTRPCSYAPVRAAQRRKGERRKVLPVLGGDAFTSNVASMLVRWPHAPPSRQLRNWQEVILAERFQMLFPRRPTPLTEQAAQGLKALAASGVYDIGDGGGGLGTAAASGGALYDAHQASLLELVERLQAVQRHLQDSMPDDGGNGGDTIVTLAAFTQDDDDGEDEPSTSQPHSAADARSSRCGGTTAAAAGRSVDGSDLASTVGSIGRCRRRPAGWQRGPKPAPPWDDTQPFQTHCGTVFHFWRLCPYG